MIGSRTYELGKLVQKKKKTELLNLAIVLIKIDYLSIIILIKFTQLFNILPVTELGIILKVKVPRSLLWQNSPIGTNTEEIKRSNLKPKLLPPRRKTEMRF